MLCLLRMLLGLAVDDVVYDVEAAARPSGRRDG